MHGMKRRCGNHRAGPHMGGRSPFGRDGEGHGLFGHRGGRGHGGGHGGGMGGGGPRRGKRFAGEELRLMVLALLEDSPMHGYQLIRSFADKSGEAYSPSPGVLYPLLAMLLDQALVDEAPGEGRSRSFALTDAGKAELAAQRAVADAAFARLAEMAEDAGRTDAGPVRRAMMNLRAATMQRLRKGAEGETLAFDIAEILDEAARKIERMGS